jgi:diguanylate cyclase (GGDEF)-like protein
VFSVALITLVNGFYSTYQVQREKLIKDSLANNLAYAAKLAYSTDNFLVYAQQQLSHAAKIIQNRIDDDDFLSKEADRLRLQTNSFNSVSIINRRGTFKAVSPETLGLTGQTIKSKYSVQALVEQQPFISDPFLSIKGNLLISISQPIFNTEGRYLGFIGGAMYLKSHSMLNDILKHHFQNNGSSSYVVDKNKRIIFHSDKALIGTIAKTNKAVESVLVGESGIARITDHNSREMLASFYPVARTNWGIIVQRPVSDTLKGLDSLIKEVIYRTLPLGIITFIVIWFIAELIAKPLNQLAGNTINFGSPSTKKSLKGINTWYFESNQLKKAIIIGVDLLQTKIGKLRHDSHTDPLTGAENRRSLDLSVNQLILSKTPFAVLAIDIDFFKRINDKYGHDIGDEVLKALTKLIQNMSRPDDIVARVGGEEFILILPNENIDTALLLAERLREKVAKTKLAHVDNLTISVGIAAWSGKNVDAGQAYRLADKALYIAKETGRNRCIVYSNHII